MGGGCVWSSSPARASDEKSAACFLACAPTPGTQHPSVRGLRAFDSPPPSTNEILSAESNNKCISFFSLSLYRYNQKPPLATQHETCPTPQHPPRPVRHQLRVAALRGSSFLCVWPTLRCWGRCRKLKEFERILHSRRSNEAAPGVQPAFIHSPTVPPAQTARA
jgi:hypothetical protein